MSRYCLAFLAGMLFSGFGPARAGAGAPEDAKALLEKFQKDADAVQAEADKEIATRKAKLVKDLKELRDSLTKAGKYEEALAVQELIRARDLPRRAEVEWGGSWWAADVLKVEGGRTFIHYRGWGDEWNEWVPKERLRPSTGSDGPDPVQTSGVPALPAARR